MFEKRRLDPTLQPANRRGCNPVVSARCFGFDCGYSEIDLTTLPHGVNFAPDCNSVQDVAEL
jgi:hypothetical protein